jgi:putative transposase
MNFDANCLYHIYNRTFQHTPAFLTARNYLYFIKKLASLTSVCDILAYCVMPDHFHLMVHVARGSPGLAQLSAMPDAPRMQTLCRRIGTMLSSYTQGLNKQEHRVGSLFQPRTKCKQLDLDHAANCFHYIHQNPVKARLVYRIEDWTFSSVHEFLGREDGFCNIALARELFGLPVEPEQFLTHSNDEIRKSISLHNFSNEWQNR